MWGPVVALVLAGAPGGACVRGTGTTMRVDGADAPVAVPGAMRLFATLAVVQLIDRGIVDPSTPVADLVPAFRDGPFGRPARIEHVLFHTAGLAAAAVVTGDVDADLARHGPARREPGRVVVPSRLGDEVLAAVVERTTGRPFGRYVEENLLAPLGVQARVGPRPWAEPPRLRPSDLGRIARTILARGLFEGAELWREESGRRLLAPSSGLVAPPWGRPGAPSVSPSGRRLAFVLGDRRPRVRLVLEPADGRFVASFGRGCR